MKNSNDGISALIFEHMPGLCSKDMDFLRDAFAASSLVDSNFFYFTNLAFEDRLPRAQQRLSEIYMGSSLHRTQTVREYADIAKELSTSIFADGIATKWVNELLQAPLFSEALVAGSNRYDTAERDQLKTYANQVLTHGSEDGCPSALHHQNCLRILAGTPPREMANRMILMLAYHGGTLDAERKDELVALYEAAPELNFALLRQQALDIEALQVTIDQCREVKSSGIAALSTAFSSLPERKFHIPAVQDFYTAFCESYFSAKTNFQQAIHAASARMPSADSRAAPAPG